MTTWTDKAIKNLFGDLPIDDPWTKANCPRGLRASLAALRPIFIQARKTFTGLSFQN